MLDCQNLHVSAALAAQRIDRATQILGPQVFDRLIGFALYLLGVNRSEIARRLGKPIDSVKSSIKAIQKDGLPAFQDRRRRTPQGVPTSAVQLGPWELFEDGEFLVLQFGTPEKQLQIPRHNTLQVKVVLLSLASSGLLRMANVAGWLGVTPTHTRNLAGKLLQEDAAGLLDQRRGQQQEYRVTPQVKAELIQQYVVDVVRSGKTSGKQLSEHLQERCALHVSERTVRDHLRKLGLSTIKKSLLELLATLKKTPKADADRSW